jgi:hypothetical protein
MASKAKSKATPRARRAHPKPGERRESNVLKHFRTTKPAPQITLAAFHDGGGWCIKAEAKGFKPYIFGDYAIDARTAQWAAGQVAESIGATLVKAEAEVGATPYDDPPFRNIADLEKPIDQIRHLVRAVHLLGTAEDVEENLGLALYAVTNAIDRELDDLQKRRGELWRMFHPRRQEFDRDGWPSDKDDLRVPQQ